MKSSLEIVMMSIELCNSMWNFLDNYLATNYISYLVKMSDGSFFFSWMKYFVLYWNVSYLLSVESVLRAVNKGWCFWLSRFFCIGQVGPVCSGSQQLKQTEEVV